MPSLGEIVIYNTHGVCKICEIIQKEFAGEIKDYFVIKPVNDSKSCLYLPTDNEISLSRLRPILDKNDILEIINDIPNQIMDWIENDNERKRIFAEIVKEGSRKKLVALVKVIFKQKNILKTKKKKLHASDEQFLKEAENLLYDEISYVLKLDRQEVISMLKDKLDIYTDSTIEQ
jgi:CarD family transcriptional regulator